MSFKAAELPHVEVLEGYQPDSIDERVLHADKPLLLKGIVGNWPAVTRCTDPAEMAAYLSRFWSEKPLTVYIGDKSIGDRFFYNADFSGFNFRSGKAHLPQVLQKLQQSDRLESESTIYVGSTPVDEYIPGFRTENDLSLGETKPLMSFWLGTATRISAHYDVPANIACVVAGRRRFTLFPPEQVGNLYVGPVHATPSGQTISLVDFESPDFDKFPKFAEALQHGFTCELEPGDAIFIPSMWWHHVQAFDSLNLLINYWWMQSPQYLGSPMTALMNAMLSIRELPAPQRRAWSAMFDHYVFKADESVYEHIPDNGRSWLLPLEESHARQLRAELLNRLNR